MKRFLLILFVCMLMLCVCGCGKTNINASADVTLTFIYGDRNISATLEADAAEKVIAILNRNSYAPISSGSLSCGFDKNISLKVGGRVFAIACDTCNYIQDLGNLRYFDIPQRDMDYIHSLFKEYGGSFPCV